MKTVSRTTDVLSSDRGVNTVVRRDPTMPAKPSGPVALVTRHIAINGSHVTNSATGVSTVLTRHPNLGVNSIGR